jgi:cytoplasmic iron level regulating protein YaaA (DUF328/UPF0246 family)
MIIFISPAKTFSKQFAPYQSEPIFITHAKKLVHDLNQKTDLELKTSMKISDALLREVKEYLHFFGVSKSAAIHLYDGYAFRGLNINSYSRKDLDYLSNHLYILSGLYGLLRPFDGISTYRLELKDKGLGNLYHFWEKKVNDYLDTHHQGELLIDLTSTEYQKLLFERDNLYHIKFYEKQNGHLKTISMHVKYMRGLMASYLLKNRINSIESIKKINLENYQYHHELSTSHELIFIKEDTQ